MSFRIYNCLNLFFLHKLWQGNYSAISSATATWEQWQHLMLWDSTAFRTSILTEMVSLKKQKLLSNLSRIFWLMIIFISFHSLKWWVSNMPIYYNHLGEFKTVADLGPIHRDSAVIPHEWCPNTTLFLTYSRRI